MVGGVERSETQHFPGMKMRCFDKVFIERLSSYGTSHVAKAVPFSSTDRDTLPKKKESLVPLRPITTVPYFPFSASLIMVPPTST